MTEGQSATSDRLGLIGIVLVLAIKDNDAKLRAIAERELDRAVREHRGRSET
jgi:hypothetical protein